MKTIKTVFWSLLFITSTFLFGWGIVNFYDIIFSETIYGKIEAVERVDPGLAIVGRNADPSSQVFSFAISIRPPNSAELVTASTEDRQWAVARVGQCVKAEFYPYPPWNIKKKGSYHSARLIQLEDCK